MTDLPKYFVSTEYADDGKTEIYSVEENEGPVIPWVASYEAACAIAILFNLEHVDINENWELVVTAEPRGEPIRFDEGDEDDTNDDDGPGDDVDDDASIDDGYRLDTNLSPLQNETE